MRQITRESLHAFLNRQPYHKANMVVQAETDGRHCMYLHGNRIAMMQADDSIMISDAGWPTPTTKERLNAIPGVSISQRDFQWYLHGQPWDGNWTRIN